MVSIKITTLIDLEIKTEFDLLSSVHKKNYRDAIESGALSIISEVDPEKALEMKLAKQEQEILETRRALDQIRLLNEKKALEEKHQKKSKEEYDSSVEKMRLEKYNSKKTYMVNQIKTRSIKWDLIADIFQFESPAEARKWILANLKEEGLLD